MKLDRKHPWNVHVLNELKEDARRRERSVEAIAPPTSRSNPYWELDSHPEVVERLWDVLGARFPDDSRAIVYGVPGLVEPLSGVVLALGYGSTYVLRVPNRRMDIALAAGCSLEQQWSTGEVTNIEQRFGPGWLFGRWILQEADWIAEVVRDLRQDDRR